MTKLEQVTLGELGLFSLEQLKAGDKIKFQAGIDRLTPVIMARLTPREISQSTLAVYDITAAEYNANPHTRFVIPELLEFMGMLNDGNLVIDLGCGHGRDSLFMSCGDKNLRTSLINPSKKPLMPIPEKALEVIGVDGSEELLKTARGKTAKAFLEKKLFFHGIPLFVSHDIHDLHSIERIFGTKETNGVWSCAALFTHTPASLLSEVIEGVSRLLVSGGVFFASYTQMGDDQRYDKLLISSTGRVKYFSHPDPTEIARIAAQNGLRLRKSRTNDRLFASQFFIKD